MCNLVTHIKDQQIESQTSPLSNWRVYKQAIRTNNDIEGWHNALNRHAGSCGNLSFYLLIEILNKEAELTAINIGHIVKYFFVKLAAYVPVLLIKFRNLLEVFKKSRSHIY